VFQNWPQREFITIGMSAQGAAGVRPKRYLDSTVVSLGLVASFFMPFGPQWLRMVVFGAGIFVYILHKLYLSLESRRSVSNSFNLTLRTATLLTLLASWTWSDVTIPFLADTDRMLRSVVNAMPENMTFSYDIDTSSIRVSDSNGTIITSASDPIGITMDRSFLDAFRLEIPQTPVVDWIQTLQTAGGYYEVFYRIMFASWTYGFSRAGDYKPSVIDVSEFHVGSRVLSGGRRVGQKRRAGTVSLVLPSTLLENFQYEVHWDDGGHVDGISAEEPAMTQGTFIGDPKSSSLVPAVQLVPETAKVYLYIGRTGTIAVDQLPRDALAVFTETNMTILEGFSEYFGQYWRYQRPGAVRGNSNEEKPSANETIDEEEQPVRRRGLSADVDTCRVQDDPLAWASIHIREVERWKPLLAALAVVCDRDELSWNCSRDIGKARIEQWKQTLYPLIGSYGEETEYRWFILARYYAWWLFFFSCQAAVLFCMMVLSVCCFFAPASYVVVNSLRHVDEVGSAFSTVVHIGLRTYDSLMLTYHLAVSLVRQQIAQTPITASIASWETVLKRAAASSKLAGVATTYLQNFGWSVTIHFLLNCALLLRMRWASEILYEEERKAQLEERKKKKRHIVLPAPRKRSMSQESLGDLVTGQSSSALDADDDDDSEPCCRICFSSEGELVSPCCCDGSMRYVHLDCLSEWRFRSMHTDSFVRCDQCKYRYKIRKTWLGLMLRSSLCLSLMSIAIVVTLCLLGTVVFKLLDALIVGKRLNEFVLGPKLSHYVKTHEWPSAGPPNSHTEQRFVEMATVYLGRAYLELGHLVTSFIAWGVVGFLTSDSYAVPWLWGTSEDTGSQEEGWAVYTGGRIGIVVLIGHYRLFSSIWRALKVKTAQLISKRETTLIPIPPLDDELRPGMVLKTPFGKVRVENYKQDEDIIEGEFVDWKGKVYRRGSTSLQEDEIDVDTGGG